MTERKSVLIIGLEPTLLDFSDPELAQRNVTADQIRSALRADEAQLNGLGYAAELCLTDTGASAEAVVRARLAQHRYDCIVIGAGVRTLSRYFLLFEKLVNVVHAHAPSARICFNTRPDDTAEAVQRWL